MFLSDTFLLAERWYRWNCSISTKVHFHLETNVEWKMGNTCFVDSKTFIEIIHIYLLQLLSWSHSPEMSSIVWNGCRTLFFLFVRTWHFITKHHKYTVNNMWKDSQRTFPSGILVHMKYLMGLTYIQWWHFCLQCQYSYCTHLLYGFKKIRHYCAIHHDKSNEHHLFDHKVLSGES